MGEHGKIHWKIFKWERIEPVLGNDAHLLCLSPVTFWKILDFSRCSMMQFARLRLFSNCFSLICLLGSGGGENHPLIITMYGDRPGFKILHDFVYKSILQARKCQTVFLIFYPFYLLLFPIQFALTSRARGGTLCVCHSCVPLGNLLGTAYVAHMSHTDDMARSCFFGKLEKQKSFFFFFCRLILIPRSRFSIGADLRQGL